MLWSAPRKRTAARCHDSAFPDRSRALRQHRPCAHAEPYHHAFERARDVAGQPSDQPVERVELEQFGAATFNQSANGQGKKKGEAPKRLPSPC